MGDEGFDFSNISPEAFYGFDPSILENIDLGGLDYSQFNLDSDLFAGVSPDFIDDVSAALQFDPNYIDDVSAALQQVSGGLGDDDFVDLFATTDTPDDVAAALRLPMNADGTYSPARDSQYANQLIEARAPGFEHLGGDALAGYRAPGATPSGVTAGGRQLGTPSPGSPRPPAPGSHPGTNRIPGGSGSGGGGQGSQSDLLKLLLPILLMMAMRDKGGASNAVIPALQATQKQTPYSQQRPAGYRPGQGGITYFEPTQYAPRMAGGGIIDLARALAAKRREQRQGLLKGRGDGVSDSIPAMIGRDQPARLARGEYVVDARTVAELGNGSTDAGAERLDEMRQRVHSKRKKAKVGQDSKAYKTLPA